MVVTTDLPEMDEVEWAGPSNYVDMVKSMQCPPDCDPEEVLRAEADYENYILGDGI